MTSKRSAATLAALAFALGSSLALAQPHDPHDGPPHGGYNPGHHNGPPPGHGHPDHRYGPPPDRGPGAGPDHRFHRGERLSRDYRSRQYVVDNWRDHRLPPPPRGHHWVQVGADYVLVAVATGLIAQIVLSQ